MTALEVPKEALPRPFLYDMRFGRKTRWTQQQAFVPIGRSDGPGPPREYLVEAAEYPAVPARS